MSPRIELKHNNGRPWHRSGRIWAKGFAESRGALYCGRDLAAYLAARDNDLLDEAPDLKGEFAVVREDDDLSFTALADAVRSIPLFYTESGELPVITDAPEAAISSYARPPNDVTKLAFLLQGTTLGRSTLLPGVHQIRAGEGVRCRGENRTVRSYFQLGTRAGELADSTTEELTDLGVAVVESAFQRMLRSSDGPFVVPLSGGLDSRLVATMLKHFGRTETVCFSYGTADNFDARVSREVAERLGFVWKFVPYSRESWSEWAASEEFSRYRRHASQYCAIEHEQDWPAIRELLSKGAISPESVVVPGHSGDFLAGSHLPAAAFAPFRSDPVDWIVSKYLNLWPINRISESLIKELREEIERTFAAGPPALQFDDYGWRHRQAMMIVNSVRAYEYHDLDWRLPLWDREMISLWTSVPLVQRRGKALYLKVAEKIMGDLMEIPHTPAPEPGLFRLNSRVTDGGYYRYGLFAGKSIASLLRPISQFSRSDDEIIGKVTAPWRLLPVLRARINGLLALQRLERSLAEVTGPERNMYWKPLADQ